MAKLKNPNQKTPANRPAATKASASASVDPFAKAYNESEGKLGGGFEPLPRGIWDGYAFEGGIETRDDGSEYAFIGYVIAEPDKEEHGLKGRSFFNLTDDEGNIDERGPGFLRAVLKELGLDPEGGITSQKHAQEILESLIDEPLYVRFQVAVKRSKGREYTNIYLKKLHEDDEGPGVPDDDEG